MANNQLHCTADLETDPFRGPSHPKGERIPEAFAAGFHDGKTTQIFWGKDCIVKLIGAIIAFARKNPGKKILIYLHNGGKFDAHFMLAEILVVLRRLFGMKQLQLFCIGSRIVEIETPIGNFRDSFALIPKPLKAFGNKKEIDIEKLEPEVREQHRTEICDYLKQDCVGLWQGLADFFKLYGCGITLASTAFKILGKDFGGKIRRTNEKYDAQFRKAFFAGRVQFFGLGMFGSLDGHKRYEIVDINSSFPWSMTKHHWFSDRFTILEKAPREFKDQCFYEITCDSKGALPVRTKEGVTFPVVDQGNFFVVGYELNTAIKLGLVKRVKIHLVYLPEEVNDFDAYVQHFYALKKNAPTPAEREFAKLFLNASYGKYAQNSREFRDVVVTAFGELPEPRYTLQQKLIAQAVRRIKKRKKTNATIGQSIAQGNLVVYQDSTYFIESGVEPSKSVYLVENWSHQYDDIRRGLSFWTLAAARNDMFGEFNNVATAASITALSRAKLAEGMALSKGVLYCDTDSILAENTGKLKRSDNLGDWKLEKECDAVWIGGKKLYVAHSYKDLGLIKKPELKKGEKIYREINLPKYKFHRWYLTKKDFDASWKTASKGVRLKVEDLIAVCEGEEKKFSFDAPNFSALSAPHFTTRTVRRDDKRKKRG